MSLHQVKMLFWVLSTIFDQINTVFLTIFLLPQSSYYSWKIKGIFAVGTLRQDGSRGCEIPTGKEMRKSSYRAINQFTEKSGLVFCVWFDYCQVITISNSLVRVLFLMQSDMLLRQKKRSYWFHALPLLKYAIGLWAYRQSRFVTQLSNITEWSKMVPSYCFLLDFTYPCKCFHPLSPGWW